MKHSVAILLALTLTFSNMSFVGAYAAEVPADRNLIETVENREDDGTEVPEEKEEIPAEVEGQSEEGNTAPEMAEETADGQDDETQAAQPQSNEDQNDQDQTEEGRGDEEQVPAEVTQETETAEEPAATDEAESTDAAQKPASESADKEEEEIEENSAEEVVVKEVAEDAEEAGVSDGWDSGHTQFFVNGRAVTGFMTIDGARYYFDGSGRMVTGFRTIKDKIYYFTDSRVSGYKSQNKGRAIRSGWRTIGGKRYFFEDYGRQKGWKTVKGKKYYLKSSGVMATGIKTIKGSAYYFGKNGVMRTGWVKIKGVWAYYKDNGKAGKQGWRQKGGDRFYLKKNGKAKTGWKKLNAKSIYYLDQAKGGAMVTGPFKLAKTGKYYFFDEEGRRATTRGWKVFGNYSYYTYKSGVIAVNKTINGVKIGADGKVGMSPLDIKASTYSSNTNYLILVSKSDHLVAVYKGRKGSWIKVKGDWSCAVGVSTPNGAWILEPSYGKTEYGWRDFDDASAAFCTSVSGGFFFHSILYQKGFRDDPYTAPVKDDKLGFGCEEAGVRLKPENAEWIRNNIPVGTKVVLFR